MASVLTYFSSLAFDDLINIYSSTSVFLSSIKHSREADERPDTLSLQIIK